MRVLAITTTHGDRPWLARQLRAARGTAGCWFDWLVVMNAPSARQHAVGKAALAAEGGIQHLVVWPENRGVHYAFAEGLALAREGGYDWLLNLDDDVGFRTKRWLKKLLAQAQELRERSGDPVNRIVAGPKLVGLRHPPEVVRRIELGQRFPALQVKLLSAACSLYPVRLLDGYEPPTWLPIRDGFEASIRDWCNRVGGVLVRFPNVRLTHPTDKLEGSFTPEQAHLHRMSRYWPWIDPSKW